MRRRVIPVIALMLAVVACGDATGTTTASPLGTSTTVAPTAAPTTAAPTGETTTTSGATTTSSTLAPVTSTATSTTTTTAPPPDVDPSMVSLQPTGLGVVDFGDTVTDVYALFEALIGSPPADVSATASWVEYIGWQEVGLYLGISQPAWSEYDGVDRLVGWAYSGAPGWDLRTSSGIGIGTTKAELEALLGAAIAPPEEPDECGEGWGERLPGSDEGILAHLDDAGNVRALSAGLGVGC